MLKYLIKKLGADFHVLLTLLQRGWAITAGAVTILLVPHFINRIEQGYYYTFSSLIAMQIFFELGFNYVVMQLVSHEIAHLQINGNGSLSGDQYHVSRLSSLVVLLNRWYRVVGAMFFLVVGLVGFMFFEREGALTLSEWLGSWIFLVLGTAFNLYLSPYLAVLEGCGNVGNVARLRLVQSIIGYILMWTALAFGAGLRAVPIPSAVSAIATAYWLYFHGHVLRHLRRDQQIEGPQRVSWRTEIFPFQWRIALSWISGYFIFYIFTPLIFTNQGAVEAGRIGMALTIFNTLLTFGISWVNAKAPLMAAYVAREERQKLNQLFISITKRSVLFTATASFALILAIYVMKLLKMELAGRIADFSVLVILALVTVANTLIYAAASYMRAHREEPMLYVSICVAVLTSISVYFGSRQSVFVTVFVYAIINFSVGVPWTARLFFSYFKRAV